jgi:O-antigen/teichoic acid export membrane protein
MSDLQVRRVAPVENFMALGSSEILSRAVGFIATAILARRLGVEGLGVLSFAAAIAGYFGLALTTGFGEIGAREVARHAEDALEIAADGTLVRLLIAIFGSVAVALTAMLLVRAPDARIVVLLSTLSLFSLAIDTSWVYKGLERNRVVAIAMLATQIIYLSGVLVFVRSPANVARVPVIQFGGELIAAAALLYLLFRRFRRPSFRGGLVLARQSGYITLSRVMRSLIVTFDVVLLGVLATRRDVGLYSASYRVCYLMMAIAAATHVVYLPSVARATLVGAGALRLILERSVALTATVMLPLVAGAVVLADRLLRLLFGEPFAAGGAALQLLAVSIGLFALHGTTRSVFVARHQTRLEAMVFAVAAALNIALNFALIPRYGIVGAAFATLAAEALILATCIVWLARLGASYPLLPLLRPVGASLVMGAVLYRFGGEVAVPLLIAGGGTLYLVLLMVSGGIRFGPSGLIVGEH